METRSQHTRVEAHLILYSLPLSRRVFGLRGRGHKESNHFGQTTGSTDHRRHTCTQARMPLNIFSTRAQVAVGSGRLEVRVDTSLVLHRSFAYPVRTPSRPEDLDWEVTQDSNGCVCVNFHPHSLHPHSLSVCLLWCVCVKLSRCFHVALRQAVTFPPPFTSSVYLEDASEGFKGQMSRMHGAWHQASKQGAENNTAWLDRRRVVRVTVEKSLPGDEALPCLPRSEAMIVWWKRVFEGDPEIDVSAIPDRKANQQALEKHKQVAPAPPPACALTTSRVQHAVWPFPARTSAMGGRRT